MTTRPISAPVRHRLVVWLLVALTLWGSAVPVFMRIQAAHARSDMANIMTMMGMQVCSLTAPAPNEDFSAPDGSASSVSTCPWCVLAMNLALPLWMAIVVWVAQQRPIRPHIVPDTPWTCQVWAIVPPSRGPPTLQTP